MTDSPVTYHSVVNPASRGKAGRPQNVTVLLTVNHRDGEQSTSYLSPTGVEKQANNESVNACSAMLLPC